MGQTFLEGGLPSLPGRPHLSRGVEIRQSRRFPDWGSKGVGRPGRNGRYMFRLRRKHVSHGAPRRLRPFRKIFRSIMIFSQSTNIAPHIYHTRTTDAGEYTPHRTVVNPSPNTVP